jgi:hypothetical protein
MAFDEIKILLLLELLLFLQMFLKGSRLEDIMFYLEILITNFEVLGYMILGLFGFCCFLLINKSAEILE